MTHKFPSSDIGVALRTYRAAGDVIQLNPGVYECPGAWDFEDADGNIQPGLAPGVTLDATGSVIHLAEDAKRTTGGKERPERDLQFPWIGHEARIVGGQWHLGGEAGKFPGWSLSGFHALGDVELRGVTLIGQRGTDGVYGPEKESFAFTQAPGHFATIHDCHAIDADLSNGSDAYVSGWYPCNGRVTESSAIYGPNGWFAFSCHGDCEFIQCEGDAAFFWYDDTAEYAAASIQRAKAKGHYAVIGCRQKGRRIIDVRDSSLQGERGVEWAYGANEGLVFMRDCGVRFDFSASIDSPLGTIVFGGCQGNMGLPSITAGSFKPIFLR